MQTVFNEEIFFLSHGEHRSAGVSARVMDIYLFMNSKVGPLRRLRRRCPMITHGRSMHMASACRNP